MDWRWVLGGLMLLIILLCRIRAGALITLGDTVRLDVKIGPFRFQAVPGRERPHKKKKPKEAREDAGKGGKKSLSKPGLEDIQDAVRTLAPPLKKALGRTRRGIRIAPLRLSLALGGLEDPAAAAKHYGELNAAVWAGMPAAEQLLDIPDPRIHTEVDFDSEKTRAEGTAGISIRIGTVLAVGLGIAVPALRWFLRYTKKHRKKRPQPTPERSRARAA